MISELAKIHCKYIPLPSHEDNQKKWFIQLHNSLETIYLDLSNEEKEKMQKTESLFYTMYEKFLKYSTTVRSKEEIKTALTTIFNKDQVEQRSDQWYDDMKQMITASEFSKLFDSERTRALMIFSKLQEPEKRNIVLAKQTDLLTAMDWGVRFEPLVRNHLETLWNCKIYESGRLKHFTNPKLGASPDGIVVEPFDSEKYGRLVEIKCPYSREVGKKVPFEYWCQMQIQMEVANLNECEYVEVEIISRSPKNRDIVFSENDIVNTMYLLEKDDSYLYWYSNEGLETLLKNDYTIIEEIRYAFKKIYNVLIKRDVEWYDYTKKFQDEFWDDVEKAKKGDYDIPEIKRKRNDKCLISDEK